MLDPLSEASRIREQLVDMVARLALQKGYCINDDLPSLQFLEALALGSVALPAADAARVVEIFEYMERLQKKAEEADSKYLSLNHQIETARVAYQNAREKDFKKKAKAALEVLGIRANDGTRDSEIYDAYARYWPMNTVAEKEAAINSIASRFPPGGWAGFEGDRGLVKSTPAAIKQAIKREMKRRKDAGEDVLVKLPRN